MERAVFAHLLRKRVPWKPRRALPPLAPPLLSHMTYRIIFTQT